LNYFFGIIFLGEFNMPHAIRVHETGGPEVLKWEAVDVGAPGPGQLRLKQTAVGLNYIDVYQRSGLYPLQLPFVPGMEAAGIVDAIGEGVTSLKPGDRVAYAMVIGAYAETRLIPADKVVKLPDMIADSTAAAMMLQGMTARYLIRDIYKVKQGDTILIHAAAGGVGLIVCQWAAALGATVIGTVSSDEKAALAKANGCHHPIVYTSEDFQARVLEITGGKKLPVVYDSVGKDTYLKSLDCLQPRGIMVRRVVGAGTAIRSVVAGAKRLLADHPADTRHLRCDPAIARRKCGESVRCGGLRKGEDTR
jgi:NADPH2:quinone reductase